MGIVLTKNVKQAWERYCEDRPGEDMPPLFEVIEDARQIERPEGLTGEHLRAYQHPEFRAIYFVVTFNADEEKVVIGIRVINGKPKVKQEPKKEFPAYAPLVWDKLPDGLTDQQVLDWCAGQMGVAYGRIANGECNQHQANARVQEIAIIKKLAGRRMANPRRDPLRKVVKRDDYQRGRDRERGDVINFVKENYPVTLDGLVQQLLNDQHRTIPNN